jgi:hypothetical protein
MIELLLPDEVPHWFTYPTRFQSIVNQGLVDVHPWHMLPREDALIRLKWVSQELPELDAVPFASRVDWGFDACFERDAGVVVLVTDERPYRLHKRLPSFADWVRAAVEDALTFSDDGVVWTPPTTL